MPHGLSVETRTFSFLPPAIVDLSLFPAFSFFFGMLADIPFFLLDRQMAPFF